MQWMKYARNLRGCVTVLLISFLVLCASVPSARAQGGFTTVTGTITDPNGLKYSCGSITAQLITAGGPSPTLNGQGFSTSTSPITLGCPTTPGTGANGSFVMRLADSGVIVPSNTTWKFTVNMTPGIAPPEGTGPQSFSVTTAINCGTNTPAVCASNQMDISAILSAAAPALSNSAGAAAGFPVTTPVAVNSGGSITVNSGGSIGAAGSGTITATNGVNPVASLPATCTPGGANAQVNLTTGPNQGLYTCIATNQFAFTGAAGQIPSVFNSFLDPPLIQNYSLSTTGAQVGINETAAPIDTHTISWRPVGTVTTCQIQVDSSPDNVTWTAAAVIPSQLCTSSGEFTTASVIANFVRVNLTTLSGGGTLTVVYSGRFAPAASNGNSGGVSNGQWVQPGQVLWAQYTILNAPGTIFAHQSVNILLPNGQVQNTSWDVSSCTTNANVAGTGFVVTQAGWLQGFTMETTTPGLPDNSVLANEYILTSMPVGGGTASCVNALFTTQIGIVLGTWMTGTFLPVGFVGTTGFFAHPWAVPGVQNQVTINNPAPGTDWSFTFPGNGRYCITGASFFLTASATVATRQVVLLFSAGTPSFFGSNATLLYPASIGQTAGQVEFYSFIPGGIAQAQTIQTHLFQTVPFNNGQPVCSDAGQQLIVQSFTGNLQAADQFSTIKFWVALQHDAD